MLAGILASTAGLTGLTLARPGAASAAVTGNQVAAPMVHGAPPAPVSVGYDSYSLLLNGERTFVWSGEFHPFRLPAPALWADILQKMRASG